MFAEGEVKKPTQLGTTKSMEVPQPQVVVPVGNEAHQPPGLEPIEATG